VSQWVIGVDEVGRGPLAGPVVTCAVLWPMDLQWSMLADSKTLSAKKRESLVAGIRERAVRISYGRAEADEIDQLNILQATMVAMERAVEGLGATDAEILIDGNRVPEGLKGRARAIVGGDGSVAVISAASILAKVARDEEMAAWAETFPGYGFEQHAGYPTKSHLDALDRLGVTPIHRRSFAPVKNRLEAM
jgi:ribonuclease HII